MLTDIDIKNLNCESCVNLGSGGVFNPHGIWTSIFEIKYKIALDANKNRVKDWLGTGWFPFHFTYVDSLPFVDKSVDLIISTDFIEHLSKENGYKLLVEIDRVCSKASILFTPHGFLDTVKYQNSDVYSDLDVHYSGWEPEDFYSYGYEVNIVKNMHVFEDVRFDAIWAWKLHGTGGV